MDYWSGFDERAKSVLQISNYMMKNVYFIHFFGLAFQANICGEGAFGNFCKY